MVGINISDTSVHLKSVLIRLLFNPAIMRKSSGKVNFTKFSSSNMAGFSDTNFTSNGTISITNDTFSRTIPKQATYIATIIVNGMACPFTVLLNVLVIKAVKTRRRLRTNANILLACLAATDTLTGIAVKPSFVLWKTFQLLNVTCYDGVRVFHNAFLRAVSLCSCLHLMLVTSERLIAIKFTSSYPYVVITRNIKVAVAAFWIFTLSCEVLHVRREPDASIFLDLTLVLVLTLCVLSVLFVHIILYRETLRHQKKIKTQQLPQEEAERFVKESKALKTTVFVVSAVMLSFLPMVATVMAKDLKVTVGLYKLLYWPSWVRTFAMLNSLLNPLIYCRRQKEMRQFVFRIPSAAAALQYNKSSKLIS